MKGQDLDHNAIKESFTRVKSDIMQMNGEIKKLTVLMAKLVENQLQMIDQMHAEKEASLSTLVPSKKKAAKKVAKKATKKTAKKATKKVAKKAAKKVAKKVAKKATKKTTTKVAKKTSQKK